MQQGQQGQQGQTTIRASIKLGFDVPRPSGLTRANNIADRLSRIPFATDLSSVNLQVAGDTVVLSGTVDSSDTARKLEGLLMLEPGVYNVRNELQVLGEGATNTPPPPSTTRNDTSEVIAVPPPLASPRSP
ncbi:MAG: BON domain-containing protein [bacterium]|nr:BON domain-containing protein [bacterium]